MRHLLPETVDQRWRLIGVNEQSDRAERSCIDMAAEFMAKDAEAVDRALVVHVEHADHRCASCRDRGGRWPCAVAVIATRARHMLGRAPVLEPDSPGGTSAGRGDRI